MVLRAASITKGGSVPATDSWRRMSTSNSFVTVSSNLFKLIADFIKKLCSKRINSENQSLEAFITYRLIPLNKFMSDNYWYRGSTSSNS